MSGFGNFLDTSSTSKAEDNRQLGSDNARVLRGKRNQTLDQGAISIGDKSSLITGTNIAGGVKGNIIINDTQAQKELTEKFNDTLASLGEKSNDTLRSALDKVADLSQSNQTGGASTQLKFSTVIILAVLVLVGTIFYFKRH